MFLQGSGYAAVPNSVMTTRFSVMARTYASVLMYLSRKVTHTTLKRSFEDWRWHGVEGKLSIKMNHFHFLQDTEQGYYKGSIQTAYSRD